MVALQNNTYKVEVKREKLQVIRASCVSLHVFRHLVINISKKRNFFSKMTVLFTVLYIQHSRVKSFKIAHSTTTFHSTEIVPILSSKIPPCCTSEMMHIINSKWINVSMWAMLPPPSWAFESVTCRTSLSLNSFDSFEMKLSRTAIIKIAGVYL